MMNSSNARYLSLSFIINNPCRYIILILACFSLQHARMLSLKLFYQISDSILTSLQLSILLFVERIER